MPLASKLTLACFVFGAAMSIPSVWIFGKDTVTYDADATRVNISSCFIKHDVSTGLMDSFHFFKGNTLLSSF